MTSSLVNAAVVQAGSVLFDTPATLVRLSELTREAAGRGADIVVFPEAFAGGYPKGLDFGARLGSRTPEGREEFRRYYESAIEIGDAAQKTTGRTDARGRKRSSSDTGERPRQ